VSAGVERVGDTVRRPAQAWTPAVHALLRHFEATGFDGAPRALGVIDGSEVLTWVDGQVAALGCTTGADEAVFALGRLLRRMHDAQAGFRPPAGALWQVAPGTVSDDGEVVCHNDPLGTNVVFRNGRPAALIDWELAAPGPRLADVAAASAWWVPLRRDEGAERWGIPIDRRPERLALLLDGYGLDAAGRGAFPAMLLRVVRGWHESYRVWGGIERRPGWAERWDDGRGVQITAEVDWLQGHLAEIERWLR
jgi:hypothetical protein